MKQDEENIFKNTRNFNNQSIDNQNSKDVLKNNKNIITAYNKIEEGLNYIVPSFWYQMLLQDNQKVTHLQSIQIPEIDSYVNVLQLCGLINPRKPNIGLQKQLQPYSDIFIPEILSQSNFVTSKKLNLSKISQFIQQNEFQWKVVNPFLWKLIESKIQNEQSLDKEDSVSNKMKPTGSIFEKDIQNQKYLPKIAVFFNKQFILQKKSNKLNLSKQNKQLNSVEIFFKNKKYLIQNSSVQQEICNQLKNTIKSQLNLILLVEISSNNKKYFHKIEVSGFLNKNLPFKDFCRNLIEIELFKKREITSKFYIYGSSGEKLHHKITTLNSISQINNKVFIITTYPLDQIIKSQKVCRKSLNQLLINEFNFPRNYFQSQLEHQGDDSLKSIESMNHFFIKVSKQKQKKQLLHVLSKQSQRNSQRQSPRIQKKSISNSLRNIKKSNFQQQIIKGTFFHSSQDQYIQNLSNFSDEQRHAIDNQNQDLRNIDSATTNLESVQHIQLQSRSQNPHSENVNSQRSYKNVRLHKHSTSFNRFERKRKAQKFLIKKKKNCIQKHKNYSNSNQKVIQFKQKKRIKHPIFPSLIGLQNDKETLEFLLQNMRNVALTTIYSDEKQLIAVPFNITQQALIQQNQKRNYFYKEQIKEQKANPLREQFQKQLNQIARQIQRRYDPLTDLIQCEDQQKNGDRLQLSKLMFQNYNELFESKKDCQQIKTIVDNSEGLYPQVQKPTFQTSYSIKRQRRMQIQSKQLVHNNNGFISEGNSSFDNEEETF